VVEEQHLQHLVEQQEVEDKKYINYDKNL
jgi:hypothetical protein